MDGFTEIYNTDDKGRASAAMRNALLLYTACVVAFVAVCAGFVVLYLRYKFLLYLCFAVNFLLTVAFVWFTVIFFGVIFAAMRERTRFFAVMDNALFARARGEFVGKGDTVKIDRIEYDEYMFAVGDGQARLLLLKDVPAPFRVGQIYDIKTVGDRLTAYKEADNG